jgi:hypothetical protein
MLVFKWSLRRKNQVRLKAKIFDKIIHAGCNRRVTISPSATDRAWLLLFDRNASLSLAQRCQYHVHTEAGYRLRIFIPDDVPFSAADAACENNMLVCLHVLNA